MVSGFGKFGKMLNSGSDNRLIVQPRYGLPCMVSLKYYCLSHRTVFLVTSVPLSFSSLSGWGRHQHRRRHLQLLPILEGSLTWTWPFTARRCQWPFSDKRQAKRQSLFFWCHGNLRVIAFDSVLTPADKREDENERMLSRQTCQKHMKIA